MNNLKNCFSGSAVICSQMDVVSDISSIAGDFFKSPNNVFVEKIKILKNSEMKIWKKVQDGMNPQENRTLLLLSALAHRLAEEISLAVIETAQFDLLATPETILMIQKTKEAVKAISESLKSLSAKSSADSITAAENCSLVILQIFKKARRDAFKDEKSVRGLKNSEIALRFSEIANIIEKMAKALGEIIATETLNGAS